MSDAPEWLRVTVKVLDAALCTVVILFVLRATRMPHFGVPEWIVCGIVLFAVVIQIVF